MKSGRYVAVKPVKSAYTPTLAHPRPSASVRYTLTRCARTCLSLFYAYKRKRLSAGNDKREREGPRKGDWAQ